MRKATVTISIYGNSGFYCLIPMTELTPVMDFVNQSLKNYSVTAVVISSCVFILYTIVIKGIDYFRHKDQQKPMIEMANSIKEVSNNVVRLNTILDKLFQDAFRKDVEKSKIVIELSFSNFQSSIAHLCRNIIINNNIDLNKNLVVANIKQTINAEYYKVYHNLSQYDIDGRPISLFLKEEWKEDCLNNILGIIYNGQEEKIRINQIYNILYVKVNDWIVYINNKYTDHE